MILLAFGWLLIGSAFIVIGWFRHGWRHRYPPSFYNAALCMAIGMDLVSAGFMMQLGGRIQQILIGGESFATHSPIYWIGTVFMIIGKSLFVWLAALKEGRAYSKPFLWSYWAFLAAWAAFTAWWYL